MGYGLSYPPGPRVVAMGQGREHDFAQIQPPLWVTTSSKGGRRAVPPKHRLPGHSRSKWSQMMLPPISSPGQMHGRKPSAQTCLTWGCLCLGPIPVSSVPCPSRHGLFLLPSSSLPLSTPLSSPLGVWTLKISSILKNSFLYFPDDFQPLLPRIVLLSWLLYDRITMIVFCKKGMKDGWINYVILQYQLYLL